MSASAPAGLRERKKRRQRKEILDAAIALFREHGYEETRVQDVIERVGISEGTFFNYFPTKDAVLGEFLFGYVRQYEDLLGYALEADDRSVVHLLTGVARTVAAIVSHDREFMRVVVPKLFSAEGRLGEDELRAYEVLTDLFRSGQKRGEIQSDVDARQLAEVLTGIGYLTIANWLVEWWGPEASRQPLEERLLAALDVFLKGCLASGPE